MAPFPTEIQVQGCSAKTDSYEEAVQHSDA